MERVLLEALSQILRRHLYATKCLHDLCLELLARLLSNFKLYESSGLLQDVLLLFSDEFRVIIALATDILKDDRSLCCSAVHDAFQISQITVVTSLQLLKALVLALEFDNSCKQGEYVGLLLHKLLPGKEAS